jgi:F-type H+-transporting ATPase subunit b
MIELLTHDPLRNPEFWVLVAFVLLVILAWRPVGRQLATMLDARSEQIRRELDEAAKLRAEAQGLLDDYKKRHAEAVQTAAGIVAHARSEAARIADEGAKALEDSLKRREQMAMQRIAQAESQAVAEIRDAAVEVAVAATRRLVAEKLDDARGDALIDAAIADVQRKIA